MRGDMATWHIRTLLRMFVPISLDLIGDRQRIKGPHDIMAVRHRAIDEQPGDTHLNLLLILVHIEDNSQRGLGGRCHALIESETGRPRHISRLLQVMALHICRNACIRPYSRQDSRQ